jgi:hypothetical protein
MKRQCKQDCQPAEEGDFEPIRVGMPQVGYKALVMLKNGENWARVNSGFAVKNPWRRGSPKVIAETPITGKTRLRCSVTIT